MRPISAVRHSNRKAERINARSTPAISDASVRLSIAFSMKAAGRKIDVSGSMPPRPGPRSASASSTPWVTSKVLAPGNFSTTRRRPSASFTIASPISGWWSTTTVVTSVRRSPPPVPSTGTLPSSSGSVSRSNVADSEPLLGVSMNPPVPGVEPSTKLSGEEICAFAVVSTTCCSVMPLAASRSGST